MDSSDEYGALMVRVLSGDATLDEEKGLQGWIEASPDNAKYFKDLRKLWAETGTSVEMDNGLLENDWKRTYDKIRRIQKTERQAFVPNRTLYILTRVAATLLLLVCAFYFIQKFYHPTIELVTQTETKTVTLPDGSKVALNVHSALSYPEEFDSDSRTVWLEGEAFFDIKSDPRKPFVIKTATTATEVLGTSFSVNARHDSVVVTVVTGTVLFYHEKEVNITLTPGEQGVYSQNVLNERLNTDRNFLSWQNNTLDFRNATFEIFAHDLSRHFKVPVEISSGLSNKCTITAHFKDQDLTEVLDEVKILFPLTIQMRGDTLVLDGKGCAPLN
jgi:transmembrane sensor